MERVRLPRASRKGCRALGAQREESVARRRDRPTALARFRDRTQLSRALVSRLRADAVPFDFMHAMNLETLGVARRGRDDQLFLDRRALADYRLPAEATDAFVLQIGEHRRVEQNLQGTRLDPVAAAALWSARVELEAGHVVTPHAWCASCGRHFLDQRAGPPQIARWCEDCRPSRLRHLPPLRQCAAPDCEIWFRPKRSNHMFHANACRVADQRVA